MFCKKNLSCFYMKMESQKKCENIVIALVTCI